MNDAGHRHLGSSHATPLEQRVARVLDGAGERSGASLLAYVRSACGDDLEVLEEVEALFGLAGVENPVLDSPQFIADRSVLERLHAAFSSRAAPCEGTEGSSAGARAEGNIDSPLPVAIGAYRVVRLIGEGGMGLVYEAEQPSPRRRVAIKVIARGLATRSMLARFRNEAQALGHLKHPGIAQIIEASTDHATGQAFFAMEYVEGPALTRFVRDRGLADRQRVDLLARVCDAVQHAHQKGVIHRDLKPGNILVEVASDGCYAPKVLDFGVAKLTKDGDQSTTLALDANRIVGTLAYMSPEQFDPRAGNIDTRSDVYALGVILYELLTDRVPLDLAELTITQAASRVREEVPPRLGRVRASLGGDLEVIAAKALHKDREQRYASAAELAADLRRFLAHEPISARPPGTMYTIRKFARRKPALTAISLGSVLALVGATAFSWVQYQRAVKAREAEAAQTVLANLRAAAEEQARRRADSASKITEAVKEFLVVEMIGAASPDRLGYEVKVVDVLKNAEEKASGAFADSPEIEGEIRYELGRVYSSLGKWEESKAQHLRAMEIFARMEGPNSRRALQAESQLGVCYSNAGERGKAVEVLTDTIARIEKHHPDFHNSLVPAMAALGNCLQADRRFGEAEPLLTRAIEIAEKHLPMGDTSRLNVRGTYLAMLTAMNRPEQAAPQLERLLEEQEAASGTDVPLSLTTRNNLVNVLMRIGRHTDALRYAEPMIAQSERIFPEAHAHRGIPLVTVAAALRRNNRPAEGAPLAVRATAIFERASGDFGFFAEKASDFAHLCYREAGDEMNARVWALHYASARFRYGGDSEGPTLKARLLDVAPTLQREKTDADALLTLADLAADADGWVPTGSDRRARFFINLARAALALGNKGDAAKFLLTAQEALASSRDAEKDHVLIVAVRTDMESAAPAREPTR